MTRRMVWITVERADRFITDRYRHHPPPAGTLSAIGIVIDEELVGVAILGRPVPPVADDGVTIEVTRTGTADAAPQVEVELYRAVWRVVRPHGYRRMITHTQVGAVRRGLWQVGLRPVALLPPRAVSHTPPRACSDRGVDGVCRVRWEPVRVVGVVGGGVGGLVRRTGGIVLPFAVPPRPASGSPRRLAGRGEDQRRRPGTCRRSVRARSVTSGPGRWSA